jgi:membrane-associated phospholipid phosphatase
MSRRPHRKPFSLCLAAVVVLSCSEPGTAPVTEPSATLSLSTLSVAPSTPGWQEQARTLVAANNLSPLAAGRVYAVLSVALYRAVVDADDHRDVEGQLAETGLGIGGRSQLEARRGAVAGAAAQVLSFFFPAAATSLEQRVRAEGETGPGNVHSQFTRGVAIGRTAGNALVDRAINDRFTAPWTGTVPVGPGIWIAGIGTPVGATLGGVTPYLLTSSSQFRPPPPPALGSTAFLTDLAEINTLSSTRTPEQLATAVFWNLPGRTFTPLGYWNLAAATYVQAHALDERAATHAFALMHAAMMDALIGCWDAKYFYWTLRPSQVDASITLPLGLPNHPSYPSGHSCASAAAATVLSHFFPGRTAELTNLVTDAGLSRMYGGIHYRFDISAGRDLGVGVAQWAIGVDERVGLLAGMR